MSKIYTAHRILWLYDSFSLIALFAFLEEVLSPFIIARGKKPQKHRF